MQPISPELREWIVAQLAAGHSVAALRQSMQAAGWHDDATTAALAEVERSVTSRTGDPAASGAAVAKSVAADANKPLPGPSLEGSPLYLDAGDRRVQVLQTVQHPRVVVFGNLLDAAECEALIEAARARLARSRTVETKTGGETLNADRTSDGMFFERGESELVQRLEARIARLLNWPLDHGEGLQILRYSPGAQYRPHYDYFDPREPGTPTILRRGGQRVGTLVMYLQEPEAGGATTFPDIGLEVAPVRGTAVFFSYDRPDPATRTLHGGAPVMAGEKWVATKWLRERVFT
ncbi:2OG-Fe(II) oxygenase [Xenophilus arseniciresistens]|uniref:2OG-Fe(II) oxygenase n=1 Tax=Xenophilus arseniciresistens TaxID=1283306 RepID=A0AAE3N450_9BURK|nr:2OG-Fe(II) oxygenase [Xenophilus arseniciresistens]MDA7415440.1 2OG-Fe(II) oxygenase [Xenophilus arseniciresistens]